MNLNNVTFIGEWGELPGRVWKALSKGAAYDWANGDYQDMYKAGKKRSGKYLVTDDDKILVGRGGKEFTDTDAARAAELFMSEKLPSEGEGDGDGVRAAYGFSVDGNAKPYFKYLSYEGTNIVKNAADDAYRGLLAHIFWVQGCDGYLSEDAVGVAIANKIGKNVITDYAHVEYLRELTRIMDYDDTAGFTKLLAEYNSIPSNPEIDRMKKTDVNSFEAFSGVTGGGLRRKATKRKATKRKATRRKSTKRKVNRRKSTKRKNSKRKNTRRRRR